MADIKFPNDFAMVSLDELKPYEKNPKNHADKDIDLIIKSIERNGWGDPLLVCPETKEILSGNGRYLAAQKMGLESVPVVYAPAGLTDKQKADLVIASNKLVEVSGYNNNLEELFSTYGLNPDDFNMVLPDFSSEKSFEVSANENKQDKYRVVYEIVFNDEEEQQRWYNFLYAIKQKYADYETISERILAVTDEWVRKNED